MAGGRLICLNKPKTRLLTSKMLQVRSGTGSTVTVSPYMLEKIPVKKRQRKYAPKVRSGCDVCKKRRLKCDEQRPVCERCQKARFKCVYNVPQIKYFVPGSRCPRQDLLPNPSILTLSCHPKDDEHVRALAFYLERIAPTFPWESMAKDFWAGYVPQVSWVYPEVKHMIIAISLLAQNLGSAKSLLELGGERKPALENYNKALHMLSRGKVSLDCGLLTCRLAVGFEIIAGNYEVAGMHMTAAIRMVNEAMARREVLHLQMPAQGVQAIFARARISDSMNALEPDYKITTIDEAQDRLDEIIHCLTTNNKQTCAIEQGLPNLICWRKAFERFKYNSSENMREKRRVHLHHNLLMTYISLIQNSEAEQDIQEGQWYSSLNALDQLMDHEQGDLLKPGILLIIEFILTHCDRESEHYRRALKIKVRFGRDQN